MIINKADLNAEQAEKIEELAESRGSRVIAQIPFDRNVHEALMQGMTVLEHDNGPASMAIREAWKAVCTDLHELSQ